VALLSSSSTLSAASLCDTAAGWTRAWSDEFEGDSLASWWQKDVRGPGDSRTRDAAALAGNVYLDGNGSLVIQSNASWTGGGWTNLTSGAVATQGKRSFLGPARICVRAKLPGGAGAGAGIWPAHWLMPDDSSCWPCHGEIDIMEMVNGDGQLHGTYHWCLNQTCGGAAATHKSVTGQTTLPADWADAWHEYAVEYSSDHVVFYIDGRAYSNHSAASGCLLWETPYYVILNTAVGGPWPRAPDKSTAFPTWHYVDYVRVAQPFAARPREPEVETVAAEEPDQLLDFYSFLRLPELING